MVKPRVKRSKAVKSAHYQELPYWILIVSNEDCIELQKKDDAQCLKQKSI